MAVDLTGLQTQIDALTAQVETTKGVEASAKLALLSALANQAAAIQQAVTDALTKDAAANQGSIDAAVAAIQPVAAAFQASAADLATAIPVNG